MANNAALRNQRIRQAIIQSYPAPYGGINTVNALAAMPSQDAVDMVNFFPDVGGIRVRKGYEVFATTIEDSPIRTLAFYDNGSDRDIIAATDSKLFEVGAAVTYLQTGVEFDNALYLTGTMSGDFVSGRMVYSLWVKFDAADDGAAVTIAKFYSAAGEAYVIGKSAANKITYTVAENSVTQYTLTSTNSFTSASGFLHILISDNNLTPVSYLYINDAQEATAADGQSIGANQVAIGGTESGSELLSGYLADVWVASATMDITLEATRRLFIDANGLPVDLGSDGSAPTGSAPVVWLRGDVSGYLTNNGTATLTLTENGGTLTASGNSPSGALTTGTNGSWQSVNFTKLLFLCNGADTPKTYNGTFSAWTGSGSGLTPANVIGCNVYRNRLYVWEDDSQSVWYGATNTIGGTFTEFPLGRVGKTGGKLIAMGTLTYDGGEGADDVAVFIMSTGEILIYQGPDPSQFAIIGIFRIGKPLGIRALDKVGPDLLVATNEDYVSLTEVLRDRGKVRSKISGAARDAATLYAANEGWQVVYHPKDSMVLVNIPTSATTFEQHVQNTLTGAWTKYNDIDAFCWAVSDGNLYFGGANGVIYQAETGNTDNGTEISATAQTAWYPSPVNMQAVGFTPYFITSTAVDYTLETAFDYGDPGNAQTLSFVPGADNDRLLAGQGKAISHKITTSSSVSLGWASYDTRFRKGSQV